MSKNLFDFGDEKLEEIIKNEKKIEEKLLENNNTKNVKNLYDKYKNYSQDELMNEFLTTSRQKIKNGSLTMEGLQNTIKNLAPFLNSEQIEFLKGIVNKVDD